ncbi:nitrate- and nitrite sensing domain-containing protein [Thermopolyspora sp. NPDC052614]|uniref:sensor histidine kinase n=1 Tax=Thermopolyspora sp. NPDC052614 TaxID=3155682 RepID=UPI003444EB2A
MSQAGRFSLQNWRVRSRLVALILLPTAVAVLVTGLQLANAINTGVQYGRLTEVARLIEQLGTLSHETAKERDLTVWYIADRRRARLERVRAQHEQVDQAKNQVLRQILELDSGQGARVKAKVAIVQRWLTGLAGLRKLILQSSTPARAAHGTYTRMIADFNTLHDELGRDSRDDRLFGDATALGALSRAKEDLSQQVGIMLSTLTAGRFVNNDDLSDFLAARERQESELAVFLTEATPADVAFYNRTVRGLDVDEADRMRALILARVRENRSLRRQPLSPGGGNDVQLWYDNTTAMVEKMRTVEQRLAAAVVQETTTLQGNEQRQALISGLAIFALLLIVLFITSRVATSLVRPLRRLRSEALEIAGRRLPEVVAYLRESADMAPPPEIPPIGVTSRDEVGEVARAFDEVHREAVRLAGDEARLRSNVNAMFVNLSRRSQTLVERQLALIESLEQGEEDEQRLGNLFKLDHLATRMRRNSENLLVLAGQESARRRTQPVPLVDIVRAAISEVENYERVTLKVQPGVTVVGKAVNDVVHLVAELVENAISFSPNETKVHVAANRIGGGGVMITVTDRGIGMSPEELAQANQRLAEPPVVDVSVSRRMGLFVVGRLALRHGIRVQLRRQEANGLTALALLPESLLGGQGAQPGVPALSPGAVMSRTMPGIDPGPSGPQSFGPPNAGGMPGRPQPVFGADAPGIPVPGQGPGSFDSPFSPSGPFSTSGASGPFGASGPSGPFGTGGPQGPQGLQGPGGPSGPFGAGGMGGASGAFTTASQPTSPSPDPFDNPPRFDPSAFIRDPNDRGPFGGSPVDTPWPQQVPPPGSSSWDDRGADSWSVSRESAPAMGESDRTGPLPAVESSPLEAEDEFLPIFAAVESDWFRRVERPAEGATDEESEREEHSPDARPVGTSAMENRAVDSGGWASPGDHGWKAAQAASKPAMGGLTSSGLPKRVPKANLVPGTAAPADAAPAAEPAPVLSPERMRRRLSSFQRGIRQGRAAVRGELGDGLPSPGTVPNVDDGYKEEP